MAFLIFSKESRVAGKSEKAKRTIAKYSTGVSLSRRLLFSENRYDNPYHACNNVQNDCRHYSWTWLHSRVLNAKLVGIISLSKTDEPGQEQTARVTWFYTGIYFKIIKPTFVRQSKERYKPEDFILFRETGSKIFQKYSSKWESKLCKREATSLAREQQTSSILISQSRSL